MMIPAIGAPAGRARIAGMLLATAVSAGVSAHAQDHTFNWTRPTAWGHNDGVGEGVMDAGGRFESMSVLYNPTTKRLRYSVTLSETTASYTTTRPAPPKLTEGFTLMMNNGPAFGNPVDPGDPQKRGILSQLFVEGYHQQLDNPGSTAAMWNGTTYTARVSAYAWNGKRLFGNPWRNEDSFADGYASAAENNGPGAAIFYDTPRRIMTSVGGGIGSTDFAQASVTNNVTAVTQSPGVFRDRYARTFSFDMNASMIKAFVPDAQIAQPGMAWYGIGMGDGDGVMAPANQVGIWMRTYKYVRDSIPSPDSSTPLLPDFSGATLAGVDYWDAGEGGQLGPLAAGDPRIGFIRDYQSLGAGGVDRLGWETGGPGEEVFPFTATHNVGFYDRFGLTTTVPAPGGVAAAALAAVLIGRRRR